MYVKILIGCSLLFTILVGCANNNETEETANNLKTQPINYETKQEQMNRLGVREPSIGERGGYSQSDQSGTNGSEGNSGNYTDMFTNKESEQIYKQLIKREEIKQAQVASADDKIVVSVMLNDHVDHEVKQMIEDEVRKISPNKELVIFTDDNYWEQMRNLRSRLGPAHVGEDVSEEFEQLFNQR